MPEPKSSAPPRDTAGRVRFSADATILAPREPERGNGKLLVDIPNRGNRLAMRFLNNAGPAVPGAPIDPGDGFLMRHGYTVAWCGWQHDVPDVHGLMRANVPEARTTDGGPVRGPIMVSFLPNVASQVQLLSDRAHRPYPTSDVIDPQAVLLERETDDAPPVTIPRDQWSFARLEGGREVPDPTHVHLASGFVPGKLYHVVYTTVGAPVIGLGFLATRVFYATKPLTVTTRGSDGSSTHMLSARRKVVRFYDSTSISVCTRTSASGWYSTGI
jgi:hypothetical protein